jgi:glycyl-tRNA synthetase beta chain
MNKSVLLEIGTEEIPARFLPGALISMKEIAEKTFNQHAISFQVVKTFATPRRLAVFVTGVPEKQDDTVKEVFGPPIQAAYDKEGSPTKAAIGFARSQGVDPAALVVKKKGKGDYVAAIIEEKGLSVIEVLPEALKEITLSLHFPKSMRWGEGSMKFVRPIHWITALFGKSVVGFEIDGIKSANISRGHRFLSPGEIKIKNAEEYLIVLEDKNVIADKSKRDESIRNQFMELCGYNVEDEELVSIVSDLVEYPVLILGGFSEKYLKLPDELLTAVMKGHQKYFSGRILREIPEAARRASYRRYERPPEVFLCKRPTWKIDKQLCRYKQYNTGKRRHGKGRCRKGTAGQVRGRKVLL